MNPAAPAIVASDLGYPEGPVALGDGSLVVTELARSRGCITRLAADGTRERLAVTGRPNGLALDRDDVLWVAESLDPAVLRLELDGAVHTVARRCAGERLLWPNDLCFGPDGALYFTDSGVLVEDFMDGDAPREGWEEAPLDGKVFRLERSGGAGTLIDRNLAFANGIAFGPDQHLYVTETMTGDVYRYAPRTWKRERFANVLDPGWAGAGFRGPDGIAFDRSGRLHVAVFGQGDITVLEPSGQLTARHKLRGSAPTNCAFSADGSGSLFVVEDELGNVECLRIGSGGLPLWT